jgi:hypothetical protein
MGLPINDDNLEIKAAAKKLREALRVRISARSLRFVENYEYEESSFGGLWVKFATLGPRLPNIAIYLDRMTGGEYKSFWVGFESTKQELIDVIVESCEIPISSRRIIEEDTITGDGGTQKLNKSLTEVDAKYPIREFYYDGNQFFFGIYDLDKQRTAVEFNLARAVEFLVSVINSTATFRQEYQLDRDLEGLPTQLRRREYTRASGLVFAFIDQRMLDAALKCERCGFDPNCLCKDTNINPRSLLDVHHKNPLALGGPRWTELGDLALLCPTCHRFEHAKIRASRTLVA